MSMGGDTRFRARRAFRRGAVFGALASLCLVATASASPGQILPGFPAGGVYTSGGSAPIEEIEVLPSGKILVAGGFSCFGPTADSSCNGTGDFARRNLIRLNADGSLDTGFVQVGDGFNDTVGGIATQSSGKIIVVGDFVDYGGNSGVSGFPKAVTSVARLSADGAFDSAFTTATGSVPGRAVSTAVQADDKILIAGSFSSVGGWPRNNIARLNVDGGLDTSFDAGNGPDELLRAVQVGDDGTVYVGGSFDLWAGASNHSLVALDPDGTQRSVGQFARDGFSESTDDVRDIEVLPGGGLLVAGWFAKYQGVDRTGVVKLSPDGNLDSSFVPPTLASSNVVNSLAVQPDGKVLVAGSFSSVNGNTVRGLVRLDRDGTLDPSFNPGAGVDFGGWIESVESTSTGSLIAGGRFTGYAGEARKSIVGVRNQQRLQVTRNGSGTVSSNPAGVACGATCSFPFDDGQSVTLTVTPTSGSVFTGWAGGGCSGRGACTVTMDQARSTTATFALPPKVMITGKPKKKTRSKRASFSFTAGSTGTTYECKLDAGKWSKCSSPKRYRKLKPRKHTFSVKGSKHGLTGTPVTYSWTVRR